MPPVNPPGFPNAFVPTTSGSDAPANSHAAQPSSAGLINRPHAHLTAQNQRNNLLGRGVARPQVAGAIGNGDGSSSQLLRAAQARHDFLTEQLSRASVTAHYVEESDEDENENYLLNLKPEDLGEQLSLYGTGQDATFAQRRYLDAFSRPSPTVTEYLPAQYQDYFKQIRDSGQLINAGVNEGAKAVELSNTGMALGSQNASESLIGTAEITVPVHGQLRTFAAIIQVDPAALAAVDVVEGYNAVIKPLFSALTTVMRNAQIDAAMGVRNASYNFTGGVYSSSPSLQLAAATVHAAHTLGLQFNCQLPLNDSNEVINIIMTQHAFIRMQEQL